MDQVRDRFGDLTKAQQNIAQYIVEHPDAVAFMTARQLAAAVAQSDAAVVRFSKAVGFAGFLEMREALRGEILDLEGSSGMARKAGGSTSGGVREQVQAVSMDLVQRTGEMNSDETFEKIVDALVGARRVLVSGHGTSYPLAAYVSMHLNQCLDKVQIVNVEQGDLAERFRSIGPGDVVIGIGYVRYLPFTLDILAAAKQVGATVVAITDKLTSPLAHIADHSLFAARSTSAVWWSQAGTFAIADALTAMCMAKDPLSTERLRQADEMLAKLGLWSRGLPTARSLNASAPRSDPDKQG
ncbi:MurR/RpiR family transcriptional regulator [Agrobacterium vitis]|uniref:MurR/RpiR family transcriptional regulator n=1 Tax=Agrobacterium vitis TaxID=373 RepID=UPI00307E0089